MKIWQKAVKFLPAAAALAIALAGGAAEAQAAEWYVAPNGNASNSGASGSPISLERALSSSTPAKPGDTIWLRGGTYSGAYRADLVGTASAPITIRAYPGERVILDANNSAAKSAGVVLNVQGGHTIFWGFEITTSDPARPDSGGPNTPNGIFVNTSQNVKFVNLIVHDLPGQAFGVWVENTDAEVYGCLVYYNGSNHWDHGIYLQNRAGTKRVSDNIVHNQASHGIHAYGSTDAYLDNIVLDGNTVFESGGLIGSPERNMLLGGLRVAQNPVVTNNYTYYRGTSSGNSNIGYSAGTANAKVQNNYFIGGNAAVRLNVDGGAQVSGNFLTGSLDPEDMQSRFPSNTYNGSRPTTGTQVFVRKNKYEAGRANVTIYNWGKQSSVGVDLAQAGIASGDQFEIRDSLNYFGQPVVAGTYSGGAVQVKMTGLPVAAPKGQGLVQPAHTAPEFGAFIVIKTSSSGGGGTTPPPTGGDSAAPSVQVTAPGGGQGVSGTIALTANATDDVGVVGVQFKVDGQNVGAEDTSAPFSVSWDSNSVGAGTHTVTAVARDASGKTTTSAPVSFTTGSGNVPQPPTGVRIVAEAESGRLRGAMSQKSAIPGASGRYVSSNAGDAGSIYLTVDLPVAGTYVLWGRVYANTDVNDSFYVSVDGGEKDIYDVAEGIWAAKWQWTKVNGRGGAGPAAIAQRRFELSAGRHTLRFDGRDIDTKLDQVLITNDLAYVPQQ